ncbi:MAG: hypothetical protein R2698_04275 [Microthrixaceae bacterium]
MGVIRAFDGTTAPFLAPREAYPARVVPLIPDEELDNTAVRWHHEGDENTLQMFEMRVAPNTRLAPHAHDASEIIAVIEGELLVGRKSYGVGSSLFVEGGTVYSVTAGPAGCRFLNFRAAADKTYYTAAQQRERMKESRSRDTRSEPGDPKPPEGA